jgi:NCS2 family nucleobase:cation symporter-2
MNKKNDLIYKRNDVPPAKDLLLLSLQQLTLMATGAIFPVLFANEIGSSKEFAISIISLTIIISGIGSVLQGLRIKGIFGSGYLCPNVCGPSYFGISLQAYWLGGYPLMRGMIILSGVVEMLLAPMVRYLRKLFPPLVVGLVVANVGISIIPIIFSNFVGSPFEHDLILFQDVITGIFTLVVITAFNIWGKGFVKLYCLLLGLIVGWIFYLVIAPDLQVETVNLASVPLVAVPKLTDSLFHIKFDWMLFIPLVVISISGSLKSFGNFIAAQKISGESPGDIDMKPISGGLLADGFSTAFAGFMGAMAVDTSSSNVGLSAATKAVSRWIGICAGVLFIIAGFFPRLALYLTFIPSPVIGASLIFAVVFMIVAGFQEIFTVKMDQKKMAVLGLSIIFGLATQFIPEVFALLPKSLQPIFSNSLTTSTVLAIVLYQLFHFDELLKIGKSEIK